MMYLRTTMLELLVMITSVEFHEVFFERLQTSAMCTNDCETFFSPTRSDLRKSTWEASTALSTFCIRFFPINKCFFEPFQKFELFVHSVSLFVRYVFIELLYSAFNPIQFHYVHFIARLDSFLTSHLPSLFQYPTNGI